MEGLNITRALGILETSGVGILEWNFEKKALLISASFLSILNESTKNHNVGLHFFWKRLHSSDRKLIQSSIESQVGQSQIKKPPTIDIKFRLKESSGGYIWVRAQGQTETDLNGNPISLTASIIDVSQQHAVAAKLELIEERLQNASECANISLWEITANYNGPKVRRFIWWSESLYPILGYTKQELKQTQEQIYEIMHPKDLGHIKEKIQFLIENNGSSIDFQFRLMHKTEGYIWLKCVARREKLANGSFKASGAVININDLKLAQEEAKIKHKKLEQTNEELEHFAYAASHDLKAPLRGLKNLANWIREDLNNPSESIKQNLGLINSRVERMENLLSDILAYSRAGRRNKEPEEIDLRNLLAEVWDCARAPLGFQLTLDLQSPTLIISKTLLEQIFSNLISNSIKHHDRGNGEIHISYHLKDSHHCFSVVDNGPGVDPKFQDKIFQIFQTLRPRDEVEGSGVGLAIVKRNIDSSGGSVWLDSLQEQRGSCFNFTLPLEESRIVSERKSFNLFDNAP